MGKENDLAELDPGARDPAPRADDSYALIAEKIATERCVILDGATGTELFDVDGHRPEVDDHMWGVSALADSPEEV